MRTYTVVLADTHLLFAQGMRMLLEARGGATVLQAVTDGFAALRACQEHRPDVLIIDSALPGLDALEVCRQLARHSGLPCTVMTMPYLQQERLSAAVKLGLSAVVLKSSAAEQLYAAIEAGLAGQKRFPAVLTPAHAPPAEGGEPFDTPYSRLTARERTVFKLLAEGHSVKQVASRLDLRPKTVDVHKTNLMRKLDVHDRGELIHFAFREGLVSAAAPALAGSVS